MGHDFASFSVTAPETVAGLGRTTDSPGRQRTARLPAHLRVGVEQLSGISMDPVRVHYDSPRPALLQALAYTKGPDVHLGPGQERHLAHEAWHVVQQMRGQAHGKSKLRAESIDPTPRLERESDVLGAAAERVGQRALSMRPAAVRSAPASQVAVVQRLTYAEVDDPFDRAKIDSAADERYADAAERFEFGMAPLIMANARVNATVDLLLSRVRRIVQAWATSTGRPLAETYEREFGWAGGDQYYGAFEMTATNIANVFADRSQPLRTKLKVVYNAVRNNNLSKWLKLAAIELDRKARGKTPREWKIRTATQNVTADRGARIVTGRSVKETVRPGFASASGLEAWLSDEQVGEFSRIAESEKKTEHDRSKRDVFGHDRFSAVMGWSAETQKASGERRPGASGGLGLAEQRTLTRGQVADLTDPEIDQILKLRGKNQPTAHDRLVYRADPATKIPWGQGGEYYDIDLRSDSAKEAQSIKARMEAGISGSTDLMMHAAKNLGLGGTEAVMKGLRLALAGWMLANRDHSFYEIYKAAQSYGVPFVKDPNNPGIEYESDANLAPMKHQDFQNVLPENKFPRYYLSVEYKDHAADYWQQRGSLREGSPGTADLYKNWLRYHGIPDTFLGTLDERGLVELNNLNEGVRSMQMLQSDSKDSKQQAIRRLQSTSAYIYLATRLPRGESELLLDALIQKQHGDKDVHFKQEDRLNALVGAGLHRSFVEGASPAMIAQLEVLIRTIRTAATDALTGRVDLTAINVEMGKLPGLAVASQQTIRDILIKSYRGDADVEPGALQGATIHQRTAQANTIAEMHRSSGIWFSWGPPATINGYATAPSIKTATAQVPSTQGPGLYLARQAWRSSIYASSQIPTVLVALLSGVPTIDRNDAAQMKLIAQRMGEVRQTPDPLDRAGLYKDFVGSYLMIYPTNGNFARLTTNQGVRLTTDLSKVPAAQLQNEYGRLASAAKDPFKRQCESCGVNTSTWPAP